MEALCEDYGELGRALSHFARFEEAQAHAQGQYTTAGSTAVERGAALQKLGYGALRQHSLSKQVCGGRGLVVVVVAAAMVVRRNGHLAAWEATLLACRQQEACCTMFPWTPHASPSSTSSVWCVEVMMQQGRFSIGTLL